MGDLGQADRPSCAAARPARRMAPRRSSIWPSIHPRLLELVLAHRSTIIFCNARRLAERLAARLNELADERGHRRRSRDRRSRRRAGQGPPRLAGPRAAGRHRGRAQAGRAAGLVATSSLELGIDMGAVDLVIQVESPGRGQPRPAAHRPGRPPGRRAEQGHDLPEAPRRPARGRGRRAAHARRPDRARPATCATRSTCWPSRSSPTWRSTSGRSTTLAALVRRCAELRRAHRRAARQRARPAGRPLPVRGVRRAAPAHRVGPRQRHGPRPRRREAPGRHAAAAPSPTAACSACSCPTAPASASSTRRWSTRAARARRSCSARPRGASRTSPSSGSSSPRRRASRARCRSGTATARAARSSSAGRSARSCARSARCRRREAARPPAAHDYGLDELAADNLVQYLDEQAEATGVVPDDRTIVVERFRDEIGDWRVCMLTPFGTPVHAPWAMAIERRLIERYDMPVEMMWSDDGIVSACPRPPTSCRSTTLLIDPDEIDELVVSHAAADGAVRGPVPRVRGPGAAAAPPPARPAHAAVAAAPAGRRPAGGGGQVPDASRSCSRPTRECLHDVFDVPALREVLGQLRSRGACGWSASTRRRPSPFAQSLLFNWIAVYMYEGDAPLAERRAAALALDRDLLRDLLGAEELRELLDPGVLADVELELQRLADGRRARTRRRAARPAAQGRRPDRRRARPALRRRGRGRGLAGRAARTSGGPSSVARRRRGALRRRRGRRPLPRRARLRAAARAAARRSPSRSPRPLDDLVGPLRPHPRPVPRRARSPAGSASPVDRVAGALGALEADEPRGARRVPARRRRARVVRRRRAAPAAPALAGRAAPRGRAGRAGRPAPGSCRRGRASAAERRGARGAGRGARRAAGRAARRRRRSRPTCCRRGSPATGPPTSTSCARRGEVVWVGAGALGANDGRVRLCFRDQLPLLAPALGAGRPPDGRAARRDPRRCSRERGRQLLGPAARRPRRAPPTTSCSPRCGTWCGPARSPTTRWRRCGPCVGGGVAEAPRAARRGRSAAGRGPAASTRIGPPAGAGPLVAGRAAARSRAPSPTEVGPRHGAAAARAPRRAHPRGGAGRGRRRRLRRGVPRAEGARGARPGAARLLRRRARRRPVRRARARSTGCAAPRAHRRRCTAEPTPRRSCWPPPIRPSPTAPRWRWPESAGRPARIGGRAGGAARRACRWCGSTAARTTWSRSRAALDDRSLGRRARRPGARTAGCARVEVRKVDGDTLAASPDAAWVRAAALAGGFADGYRGLALRQR